MSPGIDHNNIEEEPVSEVTSEVTMAAPNPSEVKEEVAASEEPEPTDVKVSIPGDKMPRPDPLPDVISGPKNSEVQPGPTEVKENEVTPDDVTSDPTVDATSEVEKTAQDLAVNPDTDEVKDNSATSDLVPDVNANAKVKESEVNGEATPNVGRSTTDISHGATTEVQENEDVLEVAMSSLNSPPCGQSEVKLSDVTPSTSDPQTGGKVEIKEKELNSEVIPDPKNPEVGSDVPHKVGSDVTDEEGSDVKPDDIPEVNSEDTEEASSDAANYENSDDDFFLFVDDEDFDACKLKMII